MKCPLCNRSTPYKVIYFGFPVLLCRNKYCNCLYGFWSFVIEHLPYNGYLMSYEGSYCLALYHWLFNNSR